MDTTVRSRVIGIILFYKLNNFQQQYSLWLLKFGKNLSSMKYLTEFSNGCACKVYRSLTVGKVIVLSSQLVEGRKQSTDSARGLALTIAIAIT